MKIAATLPDHGAIVEAILDGFVVAASMIIAAGVVPPFPEQMPIRYREETGEEWMLPNQVVQRGEGDCEDLCIWTAAGLRVTGQDPGARCTLVNTGPRRIHCLVQLSDGSTYDPSRVLRAREKERARATKTMSVSGFGLGGTVVFREHRGGPRAAPSSSAPPAAAPPAGAPVIIDPFQKVWDEMKKAGVTKARYTDERGALESLEGKRLEKIMKLNLSQVDDMRPGNIAVALAARDYAKSIGDRPTEDLNTYGGATRKVVPAAPVDPLAVDPLSDPYGPAWDPYGPGYNPYYDPYAGGFAGGYGMAYGGQSYDNDAYVQQYLMQQESPGFGYQQFPTTYDDIFGTDTEQWAYVEGDEPIDVESMEVEP